MKKLLGVAAAVLTAVTVVSCKGKTKEESTEFKPSLDTNTRCSIKVVGDYDNFEALEAEFDRFNDYYPNVTLSYRKPDSYFTTLGNSLTADGPNIFLSYASWISDTENYGTVIPHMEDLSDPSLKINLDCLRSGLITHNEEGKVLGAPVFSRTYGAMVNNDLFLEKGLEIPKTWNELLEVCAAFKEKGITNPIMGFNKTDSGCWMNNLAYPEIVASIGKNPNLDTSNGEFMRSALNKVKQLIDAGAINSESCNDISDNYKQVLLRFFAGDVPMMICTADTVSGRKKREKESNPFKNNPFSYTFIEIPMSDEGGYFIDSPSAEFSVNKECKNLDMTNEFMRFIFQPEELKNMAYLKGLISPTKDYDFGAVYDSFSRVPKERTFSPEELGITDALFKKVNSAAYKIGKFVDPISIDQAIAEYTA